MRESRYWLVVAALACGAGRLAASPAAEQPAPAADPAAAQATLNSSEDVALLKALMSLGLSRTQLSDLLPALQSAQTRLAAQDAKEAAKLAAWKSSLEQARRDLLAGTGSGSRATQQFALAQWTAAGSGRPGRGRRAHRPAGPHPADVAGRIPGFLAAPGGPHGRPDLAPVPAIRGPHEPGPRHAARAVSAAARSARGAVLRPRRLRSRRREQRRGNPGLRGAVSPEPPRAGRDPRPPPVAIALAGR